MCRERGIYFNHNNYTCLRADDFSIYAKEVNNQESFLYFIQRKKLTIIFKKGNRGLVIVQTIKCVLMGTFTENMYPSVCVEAVEKLGNSLNSINFMSIELYENFILSRVF